MLTQVRLKSLLKYDKTDGTFRWLVDTDRVRAGCLAGGLNKNGYARIRIDGKLHLGHRLAWLYTYGNWPVSQLNHKNCRPSDNRIENLEQVTARQNNQRRAVHVNGKLLGAHWHDKVGKWTSAVRVDGQQVYLGAFKTEREAHVAYVEFLTGEPYGSQVPL